MDSSTPSQADRTSDPVRRLFERVVAASTAEGAAGQDSRRVILEEARKADPSVCAEVESLLAYHDQHSVFLDHAVVDATRLERVQEHIGLDLAQSTLAAGSMVQRYRIVREIGAGGMGVVYEAEQDYPRRRVAVKVLRPELVGPSLIRRFTHEAETLALLQHAGIAQLYEAGFADAAQRRPFMAMELVEGKPLLAHAHALALNVPQRLDLMARLCDAVDHAHRRGVIHRDLKPSNVLVDTHGQPKVLDFGVARLAAADPSMTMHTGAGQVIGTLGYMSPEQFSGDPAIIDTRCDVYALGVMLHELMVGKPPIDVRGLNVVEASAAIRERIPAPLSTVDRAFDGDIDAIVAKALEKDPALRYASAAEFAADIRRHLANEPVLARGQTTWYQVSRFARRHRPLVAGVAAVVLALGLGAAGFAWQASKAKTEARRAKQSLTLFQRAIEAATPEVAQGKEMTLGEYLQAAAGHLERETDVDPTVAADTHRMIGAAFGTLGKYELCEKHMRLAHDLHNQVLGPEAERTLNDIPTLVTAIVEQRRPGEAEILADGAYEAALRRFGPNHELTADLFASKTYAYWHRPEHEQDPVKVLAMLRECYETTERICGTMHRDTLIRLCNYGVALQMQNRDADAEPVLRRALELRRQSLGENHPDTILSEFNLGTAVVNLRADEGFQLMHSAMERSAAVRGPAHPGTLFHLQNTAGACMEHGRFQEAEGLCKRLLDQRTRSLGPTHADTCNALGMLATVEIQLSKLSDAEMMIEDLHQRTTEAFGEGSSRAVQVITLRWDLAEARNDYPAMRRWADELKGTKYEQAVEEQMKTKTPPK